MGNSRLADVGEGRKRLEPRGGDVVLSEPQQAQPSALAAGRDDGERCSKCFGSIVFDLAIPEVQDGEALGPGGGGELRG